MQRIRSHLTYANVMATVAVFIALGGTTYAATGGNFILGQSNSASSTTALSAGTTGPALKVTSTNTTTGATALGLNVPTGHTPFTVNSGTKVAKLNADKLDGLNSTSFLSTSNVHRFTFAASIPTVAPHHCDPVFITGANARSAHLLLTPDYNSTSGQLMFTAQYRDDGDSAVILACNPTDADALSVGESRFNLLVIDE
jgi:hypothetical protein